MPHAAAEAEDVAVVHLVQDPAASGTAERGRIARRALPFAPAVQRDVRLLLQERWDGRMELDVLVGELADQGSDLHGRKAVVDIDVLQRVAGHVGAEGLLRILNDGHATPLLHGHQSRRPVVERAREDDPDHARPVETRGGAEERVHRGPVPSFGRAAREAHHAIVDHHVAIGRSDVDAALRQRLAVLGVLRRQGPGAGEDAREDALVIGSYVQNHQNRRGKIPGELSDECPQRFHSSCGRPDDDDVMARHSVALLPSVPLYRTIRTPSSGRHPRLRAQSWRARSISRFDWCTWCRDESLRSRASTSRRSRACWDGMAGLRASFRRRGPAPRSRRTTIARCRRATASAVWSPTTTTDTRAASRQSASTAASTSPARGNVSETTRSRGAGLCWSNRIASAAELARSSSRRGDRSAEAS